MKQLRIKTKRLELIAATPELARAAAGNHPQLAQLLNAQVPAEFPPEIMADVMEYFAQRLEADPGLMGWWAWYPLLEQAGERILIGCLGFTGYPDQDDRLLMGYAMTPSYQGQGYATEAVQGLINWAFQHPQVNQVVADTFPEHAASIRVMEKNHMVLLGEGSEAGTVRYGVDRAQWQSLLKE
jgi:[ribosomal protein S5]-alanine N-acetyltransferase